MRRTYMLLIVLLMAVAFLSIGCTRVDLREEGDATTETVRLQGADKVEAEIGMGPGNLTIDGGARDLMKGDFRYTDGRLAPEIDYRVDAGVGDLYVHQRTEGNWFPRFWGGGYLNEWDLAFADDVPLDLRLQLAAGDVSVDMGDTMLEDFRLETGAGSVNLDLIGSEFLEDVRVTTGAGDVRLDVSGGSELRRFTFETGAGSLRLDLSGDDWGQDIDGSISAGAGDVSITLPTDVGVKVQIDHGIGEVRAEGLLSDGDSWVNEAYGEDGPVIEIQISQGVGSVSLGVE